MKLDEYSISQPIQALAFGRFKVGKTFGAATFPRPIFMMFDHGGMDTLLHPDFIKKHGYKKDLEFEIFTEKSKDNKGVVRSHNAFDDACRYFDKMMKPDKRDTFDTWVVDSGTSLTEVCMNKGIILMGNKSLGVTSKTYEQAKNTGIIHPKIQDFGPVRSMLEQFIAMIKETNKNVLFLCHEKDLTDDEGVVKATVPLLIGQSVESVPSKFSEVWNIQMKKKGAEWNRVIVTQQTSILKVGSRLGIPDGTPFEYSEVRNVLDQIKQERESLVTAPGQEK